MKISASQRFTSFVFTSYDIERDPSVYYQPISPSYLRWQIERCPTTQKLHIQGFCQLSKQVYFTRIKACDSACHFEKTRGTADEADAYCSKEDTRVSGPYQWGTMRSDGRHNRRSADDILLEVLHGTFNPRASDANSIFYARHHGQIQRIKELQEAPTSFDTKVFIHFGVPGSGKTYNARHGIYDENNTLVRHMTPAEAESHTYEVTMFQEGTGTPWFDRYNGQKRIVINEFGRGKFKYTDLLTLTDQYPGTFQAKGSSIIRRWDEVHITSNFSPREWYTQWTTCDAGPFMRRITKAIHYEKPHETQLQATSRTWDDILAS